MAAKRKIRRVSPRQLLPPGFALLAILLQAGIVDPAASQQAAEGQAPVPRLANPATPQQAGESPAPVTTLSVGESLARSLAADRSHHYVLSLDPGSWLVTLEQQGLDYRIRLLEPRQRLHDSPTFRDERETLLLQPEAPTGYRFAIESDEYTGVTGSYVLRVTRPADESAATALRLMTEAVAAMHDGGEPDPQDAVTRYWQALDHWERAGDIREQARTWLSIAQLQYWHIGNWSWRDAASSAAEAAFLYEQLGLEALQANATSLQAAALIESAYEADQSSEAESVAAATAIYDEALALFAQAADLQEANERWYDRAQTLNNVGLTWHNQDRWAEAVPYYEEAASEFRRLDEWAAEMNPLANLAVIDQDSGRLVRAAAAQERLLELMPPDREPAWRADTLDNYAKAKLILGDADTALTRFFEALQIHEEIQNLTGQGLSLSGIGSTYRVIGEIDLAEDYFRRALPIREAANDGAGQMSVLRSLAEIDLHRGEHDAALDKLDRASRIANSETAIASIGIRKAQAWIGNGEYTRAAQALDEARGLAEAAGSLRDVADAAFWSGKLSKATGATGQAEQRFSESAGLYDSIEVRSGLAESLLELAKLAFEAGDFAAASAHAADAIERVEGLRTEVTNPELRAVYLGTRAEYYDALIDSTIRAIDSADPAREREEELETALETSERAKARATVDLINEASVDLSAGVDAEIAAELNELHASLAEAQFQRNQLLESGEGRTAELEQVLSRLLRIRAELDVLETRARSSNPRYAAVHDPEVLRAAEIQDALGPDDLLLQYWLGDSTSYLWIVASGSTRVVALPARATIDALARRIHASFTAGGIDPAAARGRRSLIDELAQAVLHPAAAEIGAARRVVLAADGALHYLPFATLSMPDGRPLVETHEVVSIPSMTVVAALRDMLEDRDAPLRDLALVGDPVFESSDPRLRGVDGGLVSDNQTRSSPDRNFSRLPFSGREIEQIARLVPEDARLIATGLDARTTRVAGDSLQDYRYVHFATHGVIDATQPVLSSLVFSTFAPDGTPADGFFRLRDVYGMRLKADLVVLSACETALGREIRGEGLIGLTQGFLYAGATRVIASLWQVPDRATSNLMSALYENMLVDGQAPAEALRNAQLEVADDRRWRDPYFWSGFVLLGDWR